MTLQYYEKRLLAVHPHQLRHTFTFATRLVLLSRQLSIAFVDTARVANCLSPMSASMVGVSQLRLLIEKRSLKMIDEIYGFCCKK